MYVPRESPSRLEKNPYPKQKRNDLLHTANDLKCILNLLIRANIFRGTNIINVKIQKGNIIISRYMARMQALGKFSNNKKLKI